MMIFKFFDTWVIGNSKHTQYQTLVSSLARKLSQSSRLITSSVMVSDLHVGSDNPPASEEGPGLLYDGDDADSVGLLDDALGLYSFLGT